MSSDACLSRIRAFEVLRHGLFFLLFQPFEAGEANVFIRIVDRAHGQRAAGIMRIEAAQHLDVYLPGVVARVFLDGGGRLPLSRSLKGTMAAGSWMA